jgi:gamma-glutamyl hydrolase
MYVPGSNPPQMTSYQETGCFIYNLIKQLNDEGTYYPLWGTCLGFELLHQCANSNITTLQRFDDEPPITQRNDFTRSASHSRLFGSKPGHYMMELMSEENIQFLAHSFGVAPWEYKVFRNLSDTYNVLATMKDRNGNRFVSIVEAWDYPIYGTQFHPEKNLYEWDITAPIPHGKNAVKMATYLADYFASEARRNPNQFITEEELKPWLIYNWDPLFLDGYFNQIFTF